MSIINAISIIKKISFNTGAVAKINATSKAAIVVIVIVKPVFIAFPNLSYSVPIFLLINLVVSKISVSIE